MLIINKSISWHIAGGIIETIAATKNVADDKRQGETCENQPSEVDDTTEISAKDDVFVAPEDPPPFFASVFSDAEVESAYVWK